jgi:hypothetical protein
VATARRLPTLSDDKPARVATHIRISAGYIGGNQFDHFLVRPGQVFQNSGQVLLTIASEFRRAFLSALSLSPARALDSGSSSVSLGDLTGTLSSVRQK